MAPCATADRGRSSAVQEAPMALARPDRRPEGTPTGTPRTRSSADAAAFGIWSLSTIPLAVRARSSRPPGPLGPGHRPSGSASSCRTNAAVCTLCVAPKVSRALSSNARTRITRSFCVPLAPVRAARPSRIGTSTGCCLPRARFNRLRPRRRTRPSSVANRSSSDLSLPVSSPVGSPM